MSLLLHVERVLWGAAVVCAGSLLAVAIQARSLDRQAQRMGHTVASATLAPEPQGTSPAQPDASGLIGRIDIPALRLSAPISPDIDPGDLRRGVGHIRGTALPGGLGTVGLAGHRDSFFRPLRRIIVGMDIELTDAGGTFHYTVDSTEIVTPDKVHVLDISDRPALTLITCFPFDYVGAAPERFIVHAHLLSAAPDPHTTPPQDRYK